MIKTYVKLQFDSKGAKPSEVIRLLKQAGWSPVIGDFDFEKSLKPGESLFEVLDRLHEALEGTGVHYSVTTRNIGDTGQEEDKGQEVNTARILEELGDGTTVSRLSKKLSMPAEEVKSVLEHLVDEGVVVVKKRGRYPIYMKKRSTD